VVHVWDPEQRASAGHDLVANATLRSEAKLPQKDHQPAPPSRDSPAKVVSERRPERSNPIVLRESDGRGAVVKRAAT
jgi:hypothetical protein